MGPRSFNRGNLVFPEFEAELINLLQWGRGLSTAEMPIGRATGTARFRRFNGAAVFQPRKWGAAA